MQLAELVIKGLFGKYDHTVAFPTTAEDESSPSVVILHGQNGIGKTTVLKMLNGIMARDFSVFRAVPVKSAQLQFNTGEKVSVNKRKDGTLAVSFGGVTAVLHAHKAGPVRESEAKNVANFRTVFESATSSLVFEYLPTTRLQPQASVAVTDEPYRQQWSQTIRFDDWSRQTGLYYPSPEGARREPPTRHESLADGVQRFIREAQLDSSAYFRSNQQDMFSRVIDDLVSPAKPPMLAGEIAETLTAVHTLEATHARLGLGRDDWDFDRLMRLLIDDEPGLDARALAVLGTYTELLDTRARARQLVAERLLTFEEVMDSFLEDKQVRVDSKRGFTVTSNADGSQLDESQLSSGEYQLLYLMVAALTTRRRGTIIAIDEPELSMHIKWQSMLVPSLIRCASRAAPQLILATHSPDIAAGYRQSMIELRPNS